jgi:DNA polymerase-3 subunit delta'
MRFNEVIGQKELKDQLVRSVSENRIPHALMLLGEGGYGTFPLALAYAQFILCEERAGGDSCGKCPSCHKAAKLAHPDLHFVYPVATTKSVSRHPVSDEFSDEWRTFVSGDPYIIPAAWYDFIGMENKQGVINVYESAAILRKLSFQSFESEYKVMVIWQPEKMNRPCANKLLKILEEPPSKTVFIMVAEKTDSILPTVLSRTQLLKVPAIDRTDLCDYLEGRYEQQQIKDAAALAGGNYNRAVEHLQATNNAGQDLDMFIRMMRLAYAARVSELLEWVEEVAALGRERQKNFLLYAIRMIRENLLLNINEKGLAVMTQKEAEFSEKFSAFVTRDNAEGIYSALNLAYSHIEANAYARIVFLDLCLKLSGIIRSRAAG